MKIISFGAALVALFLGLAPFGPSEAEDYYIYHDPDGKLFISNKKPSPWKQDHQAARLVRVPDAITEQTAAKRPAGKLTEAAQEQGDRKMRHVSYLGYVITGTANNEKSTWRSHVIVTWHAGKFDLYHESSFTTETEAEEHAIQLGKHWVNNRLQSMRG